MQSGFLNLLQIGIQQKIALSDMVSGSNMCCEGGSLECHGVQSDVDQKLRSLIRCHGDRMERIKYLGHLSVCGR